MTFLVTSFFVWLFVAPYIAPTDVLPEGFEDETPDHLYVIHFVVCWGLSGYSVYADYRWFR